MKLPLLSGKQVLAALERLGFVIVHWRGSHVKMIHEHYPDHPRTLPLLRDRAEHDPDEQVREFAKKRLEELTKRT